VNVFLAAAAALATDEQMTIGFVVDVVPETGTVVFGKGVAVGRFR
jgi:hypothetical protein